MNPRRALFAGVAALATLSATQAVVIGFDNISLNTFDPYFGHSEKGFEVAVTKGPWIYNGGFGRPGPSILTSIFQPRVISEIQVTRQGGGLFKFQSVDLYADSPWTFYTITGYRSGFVIYSVGPDFQNGLGFTAYSSVTDALDRLTITLDPAVTPIKAFAIDNIAVVPVPEPASLLMLLAGVACIRGRHWRTLPPISRNMM